MKNTHTLVGTQLIKLIGSTQIHIYLWTNLNKNMSVKNEKALKSWVSFDGGSGYVSWKYGMGTGLCVIFKIASMHGLVC